MPQIRTRIAALAHSRPVEFVIRMVEHPGFAWMLIVLGILRCIVMLLAYPPAHGSDSFDYFLYAERLTGYDSLENMASHVAPLYPYLIAITFKGLGSTYWLVGLQMVMAVVITPIYYFAIRPYNALLAALVSLVILLDTQFHIVFNFTASEPLYVFLMALLVWSLLRGIYYAKSVPTLRVGPYFFAAGLLLAALFLTRPPGKLLFVPMVVVVFLATFSWKHVLRSVAGVVTGFVLYVLLSLVVTGQVEGFYAGMGMVRRAAVEVSDDSETANEEPRPGEGGNLVVFLRNQLRLLLGDLPDFAERTADGMMDYVALAAPQYGQIPGRPGLVQCDDYPHDLAEATAYFDAELIDNSFNPLPATPEVVADVRQVAPAIWNAMCPESRHVPATKKLVDRIARRYRSLGRPRYQIPFWYGGVLLLSLLVPRLRRFWPLVLVMGTLLLYHAFVSAAVIDVQPRYVVVTNPMRVVLLALLPFMPLYWLFSRKNSSD